MFSRKEKWKTICLTSKCLSDVYQCLDYKYKLKVERFNMFYYILLMHITLLFIQHENKSLYYMLYTLLILADNLSHIYFITCCLEHVLFLTQQTSFNHNLHKLILIVPQFTTLFKLYMYRRKQKGIVQIVHEDSAVGVTRIAI